MTPRRIRWEWIAPGLVLFVLPIAHTTPFRLICLGIACATTAWAWRTRARSAWPPTALCIVIAAWFAVCLAASFHSIEPAYSWGEFRNEVALTLIIFAVFYLLTDGVAAWRCWRAILLASLCVVSVIAIVSYLRHGDWFRASLVGDRNAFSTYVVLIAPFVMLRWIEAVGRRWQRVGLAAVFVLALVAGACTQNRNMWFGVAAECVVFAALVWFRTAPEVRRRLRARYATGAAIGVLAFAAILAYVVHQKAIVSKTTTEEQARFDRDPRFEIWRYAAGRIEERPWFGHGYGRGILRSDFRTHFDNPLKWHGHNVVVDYAMEAGVFGVAVIVGLFATIAWCAWRLYRRPGDDLWPFGAWVLAMLTGIVLKIMTDDILVRETSLLFWAVLGITFGLASRRTSTTEVVRPS